MAETVTSSDLTTLVEPLKRELAVPGEFATIFPNTSDPDLAASLADAAAQAQIDGFFPNQVVSADDLTITPEVSAAGGAVVVLYAAERTIRAQLRTLKTMVKYEAAGVSYETQQAASVLVQELKDLTTRKQDMLAQILRQQRAGVTVYVGDGYLIRTMGYYFPGDLDFGQGLRFYGYELA